MPGQRPCNKLPTYLETWATVLIPKKPEIHLPLVFFLGDWDLAKGTRHTAPAPTAQNGAGRRRAPIPRTPAGGALEARMVRPCPKSSGPATVSVTVFLTALLHGHEPLALKLLPSVAGVPPSRSLRGVLKGIWSPP